MSVDWPEDPVVGHGGGHVVEELEQDEEDGQVEGGGDWTANTTEPARKK